MQLEEKFYELDRVKLKRWLPWLHLFRAFRLAIRPRALLLACLAILLLDAGFALLPKLPFVPVDAGSRDQSLLSNRVDVAPQTPIGLLTRTDTAPLTFGDAYIMPLTSVREAFAHGWLVLQRVSSHVGSVRLLFDPGSDLPQATTGLTGLLICLLVWSVCGVGIARMSAVSFATESSVKLRDALRFSFRNLASSMGAVIVPMLAVLTLWFGGVILGWLGHIPGVGGVIVGLGWGFMLLAGLAMALILLGLAVGWPLMLASVAVEDVDAFDAFSRVYNYLFARAWYALFLVVLMLLYGSGLIVFATTLLGATEHLAVWSIHWGNANVDSEFATRAINIWHRIALLILQGFVVSYFWTATTFVYVLLRKSEDGTPLDTITLPNRKPPGDQDLPLVGVPAADKREEETADDTPSGTATDV